MSNEPGKPCDDCDQRLYALADLASAMRHAQSAYFRNRTPARLNAAKQAEAALDQALNEINAVRRGRGQSQLF